MKLIAKGVSRRQLLGLLRKVSSSYTLQSDETEDYPSATPISVTPGS